MLYTKFQASEPSGSEEEDFLIYFYAFLWFEPRTMASLMHNKSTNTGF